MRLYLVGLGCAIASCGGDAETTDAATAASGTGGSSASASVSSSAASGSGGMGPTCFDYGSYTPMAGVDFATDVMPIFEANCNRSTCHGSLTNPDAGLYLGRESNNDAATLDAVHAGLVGVAATRAPAMLRVAPGDPERSFVMVKLDAAFACPEVMCGSLGCGSKMPYGASTPLLDPAVRERLRSWIALGAERGAGSGGSGGGSGG